MCVFKVSMIHTPQLYSLHVLHAQTHSDLYTKHWDLCTTNLTHMMTSLVFVLFIKIRVNGDITIRFHSKLSNMIFLIIIKGARPLWQEGFL